ncbi:MAG: NAD(P)H-dependent oxidoreductase subunit E [Clostridia bacterium]|nr:NAD(P)H-dependent oxidoreductase subunit E [Clostridia bacterium]
MQEESCQTSVDLSRIAAIAGRYKDEPDQLMRILLEIQSCCGNSIPREAATVISSVTGIPEAKIWGYITFYAMFSDKPRGKYIIRMCKSAPCHIVGAQAVAQAISEYLGIAPGETTEDGMFTLEYCECIGMCDTAPAIMINDSVHSGLTPESAVELIKSYQQGGAE